MRIERYGSRHLPGLVEFWNREFADRPRFAPVTEVSLAARLIDAGDLLLAVEDGVAGVIHVGRTAEAQMLRRRREWPGGEQGYVCLLWVARTRRRRGIGGELWRAGRQALEGVAQIVLDGDGRNPWYARPPAWGAPWGPAVAWRDHESRKFLATRGYGARSRVVEFEEGLADPEQEPERYRKLAESGARRIEEWTRY